ncbi:NADPH:adrenodoxin oxidoreductase, mitochondrial isoform X3 [Citrus clementina]|uniref:NADPH:adrenodoxin oxidoreductase, mitochondrial isoform X3 n=1 Tax=Citrus clementina TaxID=85681 RepID=UPI000CED64E7|nr:NADPH:adrenodoxin oxidoreductase, mitochondrial isoform X3 [Citrus x clementina]
MYKARAWLSRSFTALSSNPLRVCVVGSGPAGFYTAEKTLKAHQEAQVDIIDRLPTPFGLVRSGVAPDHPETKIVINQFSRVVQHERCSFFGNVTLGSSVSLSELRQLYHVVVLAYGAESDRALGIPGEDLIGVHSAREFVWWYNGHPDGKNLSPDLKSTDTAVILGQGNVALDVARILLRPTEELATTDIASYAWTALEGSSIRKVYLVGRRGPVQAACTAKELREILEMKNSRIQRRVYELLSKAAASASSQPMLGQRELHFVFFRKPDSFLESNERSGHVSGVHFEKTALKGIVPNIRGRVLKNISGDSSQVENGLYVCGWLKRGPTGIIATNLYCAEETVASISEDLEQGVLASSSGLPKPGREGLLQLLDNRNVRPVPFSAWEKIDSEEKRLGSLRNKPKEKLTTYEDLLKVAT